MNKRKYEYLFLRRLFAFIIDIFIVKIVILFPFNRFLLNNIPADSDFISVKLYLLENEEIFRLFFITWVFTTLITMLYFSLFEYLIKKTPGKTLLNLEVESEKEDSEFWQYLIRSIWLFFYVPFWAVDFPYYLIKRRRFLEKLSNTYLKKTPDIYD